MLLLLNAGIDVYSTMNIQHLESLNDQVFKFTGIRVRETVPDWFVRDAEEVVLVDLTPGALLNRLARGVVYAPEKAQKAKENFFKEPTLVALRELALRQTAQEVDLRAGSVPAPSEGPPEKVLSRGVGRSFHYGGDPPSASSRGLFESRMFRRLRLPSRGSGSLASAQTRDVERHLDFARNLHLETRVLAGDEFAQTVVDFARRNAVTQILIHRPAATRLPMAFAHQDLVFQLLRLARDFQVTVVANRTGSAPISL